MPVMAENQGMKFMISFAVPALLATLLIVQPMAIAAAQRPDWFGFSRGVIMDDGHISQLAYRLARDGITNVSRSASKDLVPPYAGPTNANVSVSARVLRGAVRVGEPVVLVVILHWLDPDLKKEDRLAASIAKWDLYDGFQGMPKNHRVWNMVPDETHLPVPLIASRSYRPYRAIPLEKVFEFKAPGTYRGTLTLRAAKVSRPTESEAHMAAMAALGGTNDFDISANDYFFRVLPKETTDAELEAAETEIEQLTVKTATESLRPRDSRSELERRIAAAGAASPPTAQSNSTDGSSFSNQPSHMTTKEGQGEGGGILGLLTQPGAVVIAILLAIIAAVLLRARRRNS